METKSNFEVLKPNEIADIFQLQCSGNLKITFTQKDYNQQSLNMYCITLVEFYSGMPCGNKNTYNYIYSKISQQNTFTFEYNCPDENIKQRPQVHYIVIDALNSKDQKGYNINFDQGATNIEQNLKLSATKMLADLILSRAALKKSLKINFLKDYPGYYEVIDQGNIETSFYGVLIIKSENYTDLKGTIKFINLENYDLLFEKTSNVSFEIEPFEVKQIFLKRKTASNQEFQFEVNYQYCKKHNKNERPWHLGGGTNILEYLTEEQKKQLKEIKKPVNKENNDQTKSKTEGKSKPEPKIAPKAAPKAKPQPDTKSNSKK